MYENFNSFLQLAYFPPKVHSDLLVRYHRVLLVLFVCLFDFTLFGFWLSEATSVLVLCLYECLCISVCGMCICNFTLPPGWLIKPLKETSTSAHSHQRMQWALLSEMKAENIRSFLR